ncbi:MBL fold metallo-hydrolase [Campylobacter sp. 19-13652]|uniref:MBL fold metallo-hydrolase n=1 Tax=Campylobacter sp. 19-13652 TaxID=2840180 RepID=UPI001C799E95|nr:MBL fold metallo-hydrolase [Campylobacter sp. 19-13652]BCX79188.1 MBL fold metallo-hydrolase [Campylobacter sp. 19-13652]
MSIDLKVCNENDFRINSYILSVGEASIVIDPNNYDKIKQALGKNRLDYIILTHEHFDHIMAVNALKNDYGAQVIAQKKASVNITLPLKNLSRFGGYLLGLMNAQSDAVVNEISLDRADVEFDDGYDLKWQGLNIRLFHTPGHSEGSSCIIVNDWLFCGDSLFSHTDTSFIGGARARRVYEQKSVPFFSSLDKNMRVFAGHYDSFLLKDAFIFKN